MFFSLFFLIFLLFLIGYFIMAWIILYHVKKFRIQHDSAYSYFMSAFLVGSLALIGWGAFSLFTIYLSS